MIKLMSIAAACALGLTACSGTVQDRQNNADQIFGTAKMTLVAATGFVSVYNILPRCGIGGTPPLCYDANIGNIVNKGLQLAASAIESSEKIFAASNSDGPARLRAAQVAQAVVTELIRTLTQYGLTNKQTG